MRPLSLGVFTNRSHCCELGRLGVTKGNGDGPPSSDTCRATCIRALTQGSSYEASHRRRITARGHASRFVFVRGHGHLLHAPQFRSPCSVDRWLRSCEKAMGACRLRSSMLRMMLMGFIIVTKNTFHICIFTLFVSHNKNINTFKLSRRCKIQICHTSNRDVLCE